MRSYRLGRKNETEVCARGHVRGQTRRNRKFARGSSSHLYFPFSPFPNHGGPGLSGFLGSEKPAARFRKNSARVPVPPFAHTDGGVTGFRGPEAFRCLCACAPDEVPSTAPPRGRRLRPPPATPPRSTRICSAALPVTARRRSATSSAGACPKTRPGVFVPRSSATTARSPSGLLARHGARRLARAGVLSPRGHLIYYRHRVILPVREHGRLVAVAGRAFDAAAVPATLLPHGVILSEAARHALAQLLQRLREPTPLSAQLPLVPG